MDERYVDQDQILEIELPVVGVEGTIELNGEPLGASIELEAGFKDKSKVVSDEETGQFFGLMRRPDWQLVIVGVRAKDPPFERTIYIENPEIEDGSIRLDLDLVGVDVSGDVVDARGEPVERATVKAFSGARSVRTKTASDGSFTLVALDEGPRELQARHAHGESEIFPLEIVEGLTPPSVRLILRDKVEVEGLLHTHTGQPVGQACINIFSVGPVPGSTDAETDVDGTFRFTVVPETSRVMLQVLAPSQVMWSGCLALDARSETAWGVTLPAAPGGLLETRTPLDPDFEGPPDTSSRPVLVTSDRGFLQFNEVINWALMTGAESISGFDGANWTISGLAAGREYAILRTSDPDWKLATKLCLGPPSDLEWHYLPEQGSATLRVPATSR